MANYEVDSGRDDLLRDLHGRESVCMKFEAMDAVVARLNAGEPITPSLQARIDTGPPLRIFPTSDGAWLCKWPHDGGSISEEGYSLERGGWDHEHCNACNENIELGTTFWLFPESGVFLCEECYRHMQELID